MQDACVRTPEGQVAVEGVVAVRRQDALEGHPAPQGDPSSADAIDEPAAGCLGHEHLVGLLPQVGVHGRLHPGRSLVPELLAGGSRRAWAHQRITDHACGVPRPRGAQTPGPVSPVSVGR